MNALMRDFHAICDFGGRFAGSDGEAAACEWLERRLGEVSGEAPRRFPVAYRGWSRGEAVLERLDGPGEIHHCISLVQSPSTPIDGLAADLVDIGRGTEADFDRAGCAVEGSIVLVRHEYMFAADTVHRRRKYDWAVDRGAAGFLIASHISGPDHPVTGSSGATPDRGIPAAGISAATAEALTGNGPARVRLRIAADHAPRRTDNLILDLPGKGPERVVLSAHIDGHHLAESAMDNATGLAAALSVVAELAPRVAGFECGLRVGLFNVEEWALTGSADYVDSLSDAELAAIRLNLNLDSVAGSANLTALTSDYPALERWLLERAKIHGAELGVHRPLMANSDHYNFARAGVPATRLVAGFDQPDSNLRYVLTPADTRGKVRVCELAGAVRLTARLVEDACRPPALELRQGSVRAELPPPRAVRANAGPDDSALGDGGEREGYPVLATSGPGTAGDRPPTPDGLPIPQLPEK